jgi:hypothetical protein
MGLTRVGIEFGRGLTRNLLTTAVSILTVSFFSESVCWAIADVLQAIDANKSRASLIFNIKAK